MPRQNFSKIDKLPEQDKTQIQSLAKNGYSFKYIWEWLDTRGFKVALKTVQNWHKKYLESIASEDEKASKALKAVDKLERDTTANPIIDDPKDLERIKNEWGIQELSTLNDFDDYIKCDAWDVEASEKMIVDIYFSVGMLTKNRINLYKQGLAKFPNEQIKALKLLYEMYYQSRQIADRNSAEQAIKTIKRFDTTIKNYKEFGLIEDDVIDCD